MELLFLLLSRQITKLSLAKRRIIVWIVLFLDIEFKRALRPMQCTELDPAFCEQRIGLWVDLRSAPFHIVVLRFTTVLSTVPYCTLPVQPHFSGVPICTDSIEALFFLSADADTKQREKAVPLGFFLRLLSWAD